MYLCDVCQNPIEAGTQYVNVFDKNICLDCAVRNTLDDVMATFGITYMEAPDDIVVTTTVGSSVIDATPEQIENFFHSENPVFLPIQDDNEVVQVGIDEDDHNAIHEKKMDGTIPMGQVCTDNIGD